MEESQRGAGWGVTSLDWIAVWNCASRQGWEVLRGYICVCNHIHTPFIILPTNLTVSLLRCCDAKGRVAFLAVTLVGQVYVPGLSSLLLSAPLLICGD